MAERELHAAPSRVGPTILSLFFAFGVVGFLLAAITSFAAAIGASGSRLFFVGFGGVSVALAMTCGASIAALAARPKRERSGSPGKPFVIGLSDPGP